MRTVNIIRPKRADACLVNWKILLDSRPMGKIKNGNSMQLQADDGSHTIAVQGGKVPGGMNEITIPKGSADYTFFVDLLGTSDFTTLQPVLRPIPAGCSSPEKYRETVLQIGIMTVKNLLREDVLQTLRSDVSAYVRLNLTEKGWNLLLHDSHKDVVLQECSYYRFNGLLTRHSKIKSMPLDGGRTANAVGRSKIEQAVLRDFVSALPDYYVFRDRIQLQREAARAEEGKPVEIRGSSIHISTAAFTARSAGGKMIEAKAVIPLDSDAPEISLYEDGEKKQDYVLIPDEGQTLRGKYFHYGARAYCIGREQIPVVQIDGFVSDRAEEHTMQTDEIGYRFEGRCMDFDKVKRVLFLMNTLGKDLGDKGLRYPGYTTPGNVRYVGVCGECRKSFVFRGYNIYLGGEEPAYSDDGLDTIVIPPEDREQIRQDAEGWSREIDGKTYRYYNSFCCPHCGKPYIDYRKWKEMKKYGVVACVHAGHSLK